MIVIISENCSHDQKPKVWTKNRSACLCLAPPEAALRLFPFFVAVFVKEKNKIHAKEKKTCQKTPYGNIYFHFLLAKLRSNKGCKNIENGLNTILKHWNIYYLFLLKNHRFNKSIQKYTKLDKMYSNKPLWLSEKLLFGKTKGNSMENLVN